MKRVAIFISGRGSNLEAILEKRKQGYLECQIPFVLSNRSDARGLPIASQYKIPTEILEQKEFSSRIDFEQAILALLKTKKIDIIVLAGFMMVLSKDFIESFPGHIINIHPALLPYYGGKGMYGARVHECVIANHEKESGITIHLVNEVYDNGKILFQATCPINTSETADSLAQKIHTLEYTYFPQIVKKYVLEDYKTI